MKSLQLKSSAKAAIAPAISFKPCRLTFYPPAFLWGQLHQLHLVATGQVKQPKKAMPAKQAKRAYAKVLALSMAHFSVVADSIRPTMIDAILDAVSAAKSTEGFETPLLSALSTALTLGYGAGAARARSLWQRYKAPKRCGGGAAFSMIIDATTSTIAVVKASTLQAMGPGRAYAHVVSNAVGSLVLAVQGAGIADAGVAQDGDDACKSQVTWEYTVGGAIAGGVAGIATGAVAGAAIAAVPTVGIAAPLGAAIGGVAGGITGVLSGAASGSAIGAARGGVVCGGASDDDDDDDVDDANANDDSNSDNSTDSDNQAQSTTNTDDNSDNSGSGDNDNENSNTNSGGGGNDDGSGMPNPDDPKGLPDPDDPKGFGLSTGTFPIGSAIGAAVVPIAGGVWGCHSTPQLNAAGGLARAGLLVAIPAFAQLTAATAASTVQAGVAIANANIATNVAVNTSGVFAGARSQVMARRAPAAKRAAKTATKKRKA